MRSALAVALLLGLFTEERVPALGYSCLNVKYKDAVYKVKKFERTRLSGKVTLTLPAYLGVGKGRTVELSGYDSVIDSNTCSCPLFPPPRIACVDN